MTEKKVIPLKKETKETKEESKSVTVFATGPKPAGGSTL